MRTLAFVLGGASLLIAVAGASACSGGSDDDCGPAPCGACQEGFVNVDACEDGEWKCECVPKASNDGG